MNDPPRILIVDDNETNRDIIATRLAAHGYDTLQAADGLQAIAMTSEHRPDLILLDVVMPKLDGLEACRKIKHQLDIPFTPIILLTAKADTTDVVAGLDAGADEYLAKPVDHVALVARVRSMLRTKALHDQVQEQAAELKSWNQNLEQRVADQVEELNRTARLKHFLSPQVAELVLSGGGERLLRSHRGEVSVVCCDLRGFTAFAESSEPEEVMDVLQSYHITLGELIRQYQGTVERFAGDDVLVLFNDPLPCRDPPIRAVEMATDMRKAIGQLALTWRERGHDLGFGIGISHGFATLGCVGFEGRLQYSVTGSVANLASRLCGEARDGQILIDSRVRKAVENVAELEPLGDLELKGFRRPVSAFNVFALTSPC